jgi:integrase
MPGSALPRKRKDGSTVYRAQWRPPGDGSDANRRTKTFPTKGLANGWITEQDSTHKAGTWTDPRDADMLFEHVADELRDIWANLAPKTAVGYESILNKHLLPEFGDRRLGAITPALIQKFANTLAGTLKPNTVHNVMDVLRSVLGLAVGRRYIALSPYVTIQLPSAEDGESHVNPLTNAQVDRLVEHLPEHWRLPVLLDAYTGLRAGELWALKLTDINLLRCELRVDEALKEVTRAAAAKLPAAQRITGSLIIGPTKTYAKRNVSFPRFLRERLAAAVEEAISEGRTFLFATPDGDAVRHNNFYKRVFVPAARAAFPEITKLAELSALAEGKKTENVSPFRFHDLRHTCASWLIDEGAHPKRIQTRLGHKKLSTTMDTYGHLFPDAEPEMADMLDARYRAAQEPTNVRPLRSVDGEG